MAKTRTPRKAQGLGDTIEQITEATGIKKLGRIYSRRGLRMRRA
jgi:hypothetical protein